MNGLKFSTSFVAATVNVDWRDALLTVFPNLAKSAGVVAIFRSVSLEARGVMALEGLSELLA